MPRVIDCSVTDAIELPELIEALDGGGFDARDEDCFASFGPLLKRLGNNRNFLADLMIAELKERCREQVRDNQYSAQVVMLHTSRAGYMMRANFWPAMQDTVVRQSGTDPFFYNVAHDHNFSFLTVGYLGPGYWSDYYEYDYGAVAGFPGEEVALRFVEKARLEPGKVMLYRAHKDIHLQLPADSLSVSINIVEIGHCATFRDQYRFDLATNTISGIMNRISIEPMLMLAAHRGEEGEQLLRDYSREHPSDRIRWCALKARAGATASLDERVAILEEGAASPRRLVAEMSRQALSALEAGRAWIEAAPLLEEPKAA